MTTTSFGGAGGWAVDCEAKNAAAAASRNLRMGPHRAPAEAGPRRAAIAALARRSRLLPPQEYELTELRPKPFVDDLRVRLAGHGLHRLADEEAEQLLLAGLVLGDLVGVGGENLVDLGIDGASVARLLQRFPLNDHIGGIAAFE